MKRISIFLISLFFLFHSSLLAYTYSTNPKDFINELVNDAISKLSDKDLNKDQKRNFISKMALQNVDIKALGLYTLGELRKSSTKDDISNYQASFEKYFLKSLTSRLTDYSSSKFELVGEDKKSSQELPPKTGRQSADRQTDGRMDGRTDRHTDRKKDRRTDTETDRWT